MWVNVSLQAALLTALHDKMAMRTNHLSKILEFYGLSPLNHQRFSCDRFDFVWAWNRCVTMETIWTANKLFLFSIFRDLIWHWSKFRSHLLSVRMILRCTELYQKLHVICNSLPLLLSSKNGYLTFQNLLPYSFIYDSTYIIHEHVHTTHTLPTHTHTYIVQPRV